MKRRDKFSSMEGHPVDWDYAGAHGISRDAESTSALTLSPKLSTGLSTGFSAQYPQKSKSRSARATGS